MTPHETVVEDEPARDELIVAVYDALRDLAQSYLRRERPDHTLQPTALVHEAYMRLAEQEGIRWQSREHFLGIAAIMMRRVLVNHAVSHKREKRGGGRKVSFANVEGVAGVEEVDVAELDEALDRLARHHPLESRVVELRFFGGLTIEETARALDVSDSTVERAWNFARAWLRREMGST